MVKSCNNESILLPIITLAVFIICHYYQLLPNITFYYVFETRQLADVYGISYQHILYEIYY